MSLILHPHYGNSVSGLNGVEEVRLLLTVTQLLNTEMLLTLLSVTSVVVCRCLPGLGGTDRRFLPFSCWNKSCSLGGKEEVRKVKSLVMKTAL